MGRRSRPGYTRVDLEMPDAVYAAVAADAARRGESVYTYLTTAAAKRAKVAFQPRPRGRPKNPPADQG